MTTKILLVDDDAVLTDMLAEYLTHEHFQVSQAASAEAAIERFDRGEVFDLCVFDIMMPGLSGLDLLQRIRPKLTTPVIMLTGKGDDIDRILGLEMGADDYLAKPANPRELLARIKAVLRRGSITKSTNPSGLQQVGVITLDTALRSAQVSSVDLSLTAAEFNVLALLMNEVGQVVTKEWLTEQVLHRKLTAYDRSIDVHVSRVRQKLDQAQPGLAQVIKTVRGEGYQMIPASGG